MYNLFEPMDAATVNINVSAASQNVLVQNFSGENQIRVTNDGSATVWVRFGGSGVTASMSTDIPVLSKTYAGFSVPSANSTVYAAVIAAGATGSVYFTPGAGI